MLGFSEVGRSWGLEKAMGKVERAPHASLLLVRVPVCALAVMGVQGAGCLVSLALDNSSLRGQIALGREAQSPLCFKVCHPSAVNRPLAS